MNIRNILSKIKTKIYRVLHSTILFRFKYGVRVSKSVWEDEYQGKKWDFLFSEDEKEHYQVIINQVESVNNKPVILDIGCGPGVLYDYFNKALKTEVNYKGIDISEVAINQAKEKFPTGDFDAVDYDFENVSGKFNVVILNEALYYFVKPIKTLRKIVDENLEKDGIMVISMFKDAANKNEVLWQEVDEEFNVLKQQVVKNDKGVAWTIKTIAVK